jgi:hypothetical protein
MPHLAVPFLVGHRGGGGRLCCRLSSVALPQGLHDAAAVADVRSGGRLWLPLSTGRVHGPSVRTVDVRRLRRPSAQSSRCPRNWTLRQCPRSVWEYGRVLAGRRLSATNMAAALSGTGTPRPLVADHPYTPAADGAGCGSGHRPPPADTARCPSACGTAATCRCRPDGWIVAAERVSGRRRNWTLQASPVHRSVRNHGRCPDGRCPPGTLPQAAGGRGYRNRSPARRPLEGCRHHR